MPNVLLMTKLDSTWFVFVSISPSFWLILFPFVCLSLFSTCVCCVIYTLCLSVSLSHIHVCLSSFAHLSPSFSFCLSLSSSMCFCFSLAVSVCLIFDFLSSCLSTPLLVMIKCLCFCHCLCFQNLSSKPHPVIFSVIL